MAALFSEARDALGDGRLQSTLHGCSLAAELVRTRVDAGCGWVAIRTWVNTMPMANNSCEPHCGPDRLLPSMTTESAAVRSVLSWYEIWNVSGYRLDSATYRTLFCRVKQAAGTAMRARSRRVA
eukprot:scaffold2260_cov134-Isochrysis_galbana.AAC.5